MSNYDEDGQVIGGRPVEPELVQEFNGRSRDLDKLFASLAKAQGVMEAADKDRRVDFATRGEGGGGRMNYAYATLAGVMAVCRKPLADNGLSVVQLVSQMRGGGLGVVTVETVLGHESGQWIQGRLSLPVAGTTAQAVGSAITYARRYALMAMVGVVTDEDDDDGQSASQRPAPERISEGPARRPVERMQEQGATTGHWINDQRSRTRFWAASRDMGLKPMETHKLLEVVHIADFPGTIDEALAKLQAAIDGAQDGAQDEAPQS